MERRTEYYRITNNHDIFGLNGNFESVESALASINESYKMALSKGYDNRDNKWLIVCVQVCAEFDKDGNFLKRTTEEFVMDAVEYGEYDEKFVIVVS